MRSRAVSLPLACTLSTAASPTGCSVSSLRLRSSASLPAVVWMSMVCSAAGSAVWSVTLVMGSDVIGRRRGGVLGWAVMDTDDSGHRWTQAALRAGLIGTGLGWRQLDVVAQTGSTNADLFARAASGTDIAGAVLIAEHQTAGRGRHGRGWSATPRAQITMSVGVQHRRRADRRVGLAAAGHRGGGGRRGDPAVRAIQVGLKWPNDVLAANRRQARRHPGRGGAAGGGGRLGAQRDAQPPEEIDGAGRHVAARPWGAGARPNHVGARAAVAS